MPDQSEQKNSSDHVFCAHCGIENVQGSYSCTRCGERLIEVTTKTATSMGLVSCARCGSANNTRAAYCWVCGTEMNDAVRISPAPQAKPKSTATTYQPDINPISVPTSAREPEDDRADLRGPTEGSMAGAGQDVRVEATQSPASGADGLAMDEGPVINTSGVRSAKVPPEIKGWNWAAFLVTPIWGIFSGVPVAALMFAVYLPFFPSWLRFVALLGGSLYLGFRGNELAWRGKKWRSVRHFKFVQQRWLIASVGLNVIGLVFLLLSSGPALEG